MSCSFCLSVRYMCRRMLEIVINGIKLLSVVGGGGCAGEIEGKGRKRILGRFHDQRGSHNTEIMT